MTKTKRPRWAKDLRTSQWRHLQQGQGKTVPTLRGLREDAATCQECRHILRLLDALAEEARRG